MVWIILRWLDSPLHILKKSMHIFLKYWNKKNLVFISLFTVIGFLALQIPVSRLAGSKVTFSLFDFFGPIATSFIGTIPGVTAIFLMRFFDFLIHGGQLIEIVDYLRYGGAASED